MIRCLCLLLLIVYPTLAQQVLSVEEAVRIGLEKNFSIRIARNTAEIARNNTGLGRANFLPTLDAVGAYQVSRFDQETNSPFSFGSSTTRLANGQISLNWTLFDGFRMFADRGRYRALAAAGEAQARNTIENMVVSIVSAYFELARQQQLLQAAEENRGISRLRLEKEELRRSFGGASSTDLLNARVAYNVDQADYLNRELQVQIARKNLNLLLGQNPGLPLAVDEEIVIPPLRKDYPELLEAARKNNSNLLAAYWSQRAAQKAVGVSRSGFLPRISLGAAYGYTDRLTSSDSPRFPDDISTQSRDANIGLNLSWNLFDGFRTKIERQNAHISARNEALRLEQLELELEGLVREIYDTYQKRLELLALEQENVETARRNLDLFGERYRMGAVTSLEFRDAQLNLSRARTAFIAARFQARISRLELDRLTGELSIY